MIERYLRVVAQQRLPRHLVLPPGALSGCLSSVPARDKRWVCGARRWRRSLRGGALRERTLVKLRNADPIETVGLVLSREAPAARVRRLMANDVDTARNVGDQSLDRLPSALGATVVYNPSDRIARDVQLSHGEVSRGASPRELRGRNRPLVQVNTKNGFHGCFYGRLGFEARLNGDAASLHLPFIAGNEYLDLKPASRGAIHRHAASIRELVR